MILRLLFPADEIRFVDSLLFHRGVVSDTPTPMYSRKLKKSPSDHIHARYYQRQTNPIIIIGFMKRKFRRDKISLSVDIIGLSLRRKTPVLNEMKLLGVLLRVF